MAESSSKEPKQEAAKARYDDFALYYATNGENGAKAARDAGYAKNSAAQTARHLLSIPYVQEQIMLNRQELRSQADVTADELRQKFRRNDMLAIARKDLGASNRALELLGKTAGLLSDKVIHEDAKTEEIKEAERAEVEAEAQARVIQITRATA